MNLALYTGLLLQGETVHSETPGRQADAYESKLFNTKFLTSRILIYAIEARFTSYGHWHQT